MAEKNLDPESPNIALEGLNFNRVAPLEQRPIQISQELRTRQSHMAQGYALQKISYLENQRHAAPYKRDEVWQDDINNVRLDQAINVAKIARTLMMNDIAIWAQEVVQKVGLSEDEFNVELSSIWERYVKQVTAPEVSPEEPISPRDENEPESENEEEALALEELEPDPVINRPDIPEDAPQSQVEAPPEVSLGDILGKIAEDNSKD